MATLPVWSRKPKHKEEVIATDQGWVVKRTGEILVRVRDLKNKLKNLTTEIKRFNEDMGSLGFESAEMESKGENYSSKIGDKLEKQVYDYLNESKKEKKTTKQRRTRKTTAKSAPKRRGRPPKSTKKSQQVKTK